MRLGNFFESSDGTLYRCRGIGLGWHPLRERYSYHYRHIRTTLELRATLRAGPFAWPGGYALYLVTDDGEALCFQCARSAYRQISESVRTRAKDDWRVVGCYSVEGEEEPVTCCHCNQSVDSALREDAE